MLIGAIPNRAGWTAAALVAVVAGAAWTTPARAQGGVGADRSGTIAPYAGRWFARSPADCRNRTDDPDRVPLTFAAGKLDFYESHCTVRSSLRRGARIALRSTCTSEGVASEETVMVTMVDGDTMRVDAYGPAGIRNQLYRRCRGR